MFKKVMAVKLNPMDVANDLRKAIRAFNKVLGWGSTAALEWLVNPPIYGPHIMVAVDYNSDVEAYVFASPRTDECDFHFRLLDDGGIEGWSHGARIVLRADSAMAESCGGHWVSVRLLEDGDLDINVGDRPSSMSWADSFDPYTGEDFELSPDELRAMRINRILAAMEATDE